MGSNPSSATHIEWMYATQIRAMLTDLQTTYGYGEQDAMLVLNDILAHEYMDKKKGK